ncbi:LysR substrate-binding domain-containing protein [Flavobacteriaceae bacterium]|nr:LysR substrate-binding domain-containing protein [Flavobacteriaceae bacterium]
MTITQLNYVLAVAEHKNFTKAAEHSFVTQPTLSMQIQKLEDELGIKIFNRNKKPIELTQVGIKIVSQAKNIVNESDRISDIIDQEKGFIGGEYKIGIIPTIMPTLLPLFIKTFIQKYPKVNLKIKELTTKEIIKQLNEGQLDAALAATPLEVENIIERPLYYEPFVGYIPKNHRLRELKNIDVSDLSLNDLLLLEDGHCFRDGIINLCSASKTNSFKRFKLESGSFETLTKLANEGLGMTLLPYLHSEKLDASDKNNLKQFSDPKPAREVSLLHHKNELKIQITNALKSTIDGVIRGAIAFQDVNIISPKRK